MGVALAACGGTVKSSQPTLATTAEASNHPEAPDHRPARTLAVRVREALIDEQTLGETWAKEARPRSVPCSIDPWRGAMAKRSSPIYRSSYVALQQIAAAFPTVRAARHASDALASDAGQRCLRRAMIAEAEDEMPAADYETVRVLREESPRTGVAAIRSEMQAVNIDSTVYIDQVRARSGSYVASAVIAASTEPLDAGISERLIAIIDERLRQAAR